MNPLRALWAGARKRTLGEIIDWRLGLLAEAFGHGLAGRVMSRGAQAAFTDQAGSLGPGALSLDFGFVDAEERLADPETIMRSPVEAFRAYMSALREETGMAPSDERLLDAIDAFHFVDTAAELPRCTIDDAEAGRERRLRLDAVLAPPAMSVVTAWFPDESPWGRAVLELLGPATWHVLLLNRRVGMPVLRQRDYGDADYGRWRMVYLGPVLPLEEAVLSEVISLNFLPHVPGAALAS